MKARLSDENSILESISSRVALTTAVCGYLFSVSLEAGAHSKQALGMSFSWFSDTVIIFSKGNSLEEFTWLEQASRLFFQRLILANILARGALSHGKLYSQLEKNIFIGEALIEAYQSGEDQNWIGLLLAPSVYQKLEGTQLDVRQRYNYRRVPREGVMCKLGSQNVFAFAFNNGTINGANPLLTDIRNMMRNAPEAYRGKYERSEKSIMTHMRSVTTSA